MRLLETLREIEEEELHSFYMPGHKRHPDFIKKLENLVNLDITEIPKADHLHDPKSCILETQKTIASFYGSGDSRVLINGSTVGILSMIIGSLDEGDHVLLNRNAHKSIYNAVEFAKLRPHYYLPEYDDYLGIVTDYDLNKIKEMIVKSPDIKAVILTYPTYEGICMSIEPIISFCHERNILVLVDEAHGAHFKLNSDYPESALDLGADIVVQSFHKTLPALTQTACLHYGKHLFQTEMGLRIIKQVDDCLKTFQSSSPSYVLMASVDVMMTLILEKGNAWSQRLIESTNEFYDHTKDLKTMSFYQTDLKKDPSKLVLMVNPAYYESGSWDGEVISTRLRDQYRIQVEYETKTMLLFMSSICSDLADFKALEEALLELDQQRIQTFKNKVLNKETLVLDQSNAGGLFQYKKQYEQIVSLDHQVYMPYEVKRKPHKIVAVEDAVGEVSVEFLTPYPPGIPICVPGELITQETIDLLKQLLKEELTQLTILERRLG